MTNNKTFLIQKIKTKITSIESNFTYHDFTVITVITACKSFQTDTGIAPSSSYKIILYLDIRGS